MEQPRKVEWVKCPDCGKPQPRYENSSEEIKLCYECAAARAALNEVKESK